MKRWNLKEPLGVLAATQSKLLRFSFLALVLSLSGCAFDEAQRNQDVGAAQAETRAYTEREQAKQKELAVLRAQSVRDELKSWEDVQERFLEFAKQHRELPPGGWELLLRAMKPIGERYTKVIDPNAEVFTALAAHSRTPAEVMKMLGTPTRRRTVSNTVEYWIYEDYKTVDDLTGEKQPLQVWFAFLTTFRSDQFVFEAGTIK